MQLLLRWSGPTLLALLCVADILLQYTVTVLGATGASALPPAVVAALEQLVGVTPGISAAQRVLQALRPAGLLLGLQLYR